MDPRRNMTSLHPIQGLRPGKDRISKGTSYSTPKTISQDCSNDRAVLSRRLCALGDNRRRFKLGTNWAVDGQASDDGQNTGRQGSMSVLT